MPRKRQKVWLAILGSVLLHGIVLVAFALVVSLRPPAEAPKPPDEEPLNLEIVKEEATPTPPPTTVDVATPTPTPRKFVDLPDQADSPDVSPPPDATLQAQRNSVASNAGSTGGDKAAATQEGSRMASFAFDTTPPSPGLQISSTPPPPPTEQTAPSLPKPDRAAPTPAATPASTPPPEATPLPSVAADEFAMIMATPTPPPEDPFDPSFRSTAPPLPKPIARASPMRSPPPLPASLRSASVGNITNRGAGGVDAVSTPVGRYTKSVTESIKFIWNRAVEATGDGLPSGAVVIGFVVDPTGQVHAPRILSNTSDANLAAISLQAVTRARLPPVPADVLTEVGEDQFAIKISFELVAP